MTRPSCSAPTMCSWGVRRRSWSPPARYGCRPGPNMSRIRVPRIERWGALPRNTLRLVIDKKTHFPARLRTDVRTLGARWLQSQHILSTRRQRYTAQTRNVPPAIGTHRHRHSGAGTQQGSFYTVGCAVDSRCEKLRAAGSTCKKLKVDGLPGGRRCKNRAELGGTLHVNRCESGGRVTHLCHRGTGSDDRGGSGVE